jgi:hypothetical protein
MSDILKKKFYNINTDNIVGHITTINFNALCSSTYSSIYNEKIGHTDNLKEYIAKKNEMIQIISEKEMKQTKLTRLMTTMNKFIEEGKGKF